MPTQTQPAPSPEDERNPADKHYDDTFNRLTSAEHMAKDGQPGITRSGDKDSFNKLKAAEQQSTGDVTGQDQPNDTLGQGFSAGASKQPNGKRGFKGKLRGLAKKKSSYIVAAGLATVIGSAIAFFAMLPLKIVGTMTSIDNVFESAQQQAVGKMNRRLLNRYVAKDVVQALKTGECRSTRSPKCVVTPKESGPIGKLYRAWADKKLEYKLANEHGIIFEAHKNGHFYMSVNGSAADLHDVINGKKTIFELNTKEMSPAEIRRYVSDSFKEASLWDKTYTRFKVSRYLSRQVGLPRCIFAGCKKDNNISDRYFNKKQDIKFAAKAGIMNRVVTPVSQQWGFMFSCIIAPDDCPSNKLEEAEPGDTDRQTKAHRKVQTSIAKAAADLSHEDYDKMLQRAKDIGEKGPGKFVIESIGKAIGGETGKKLLSSSVPVVGWIILAAQLIHGLAEAGPTIQHIGYAINSQGAMALYQTYDTMNSQIKSGNANLAAAGSMSDALSSNMDPTSKDDFDMASTPVYNKVMGGGQSNQSSVATAILGGTAFAASEKQRSGHCDGGDEPDKDSGICPEEKLDQKNAQASAISDAISSIPGLAPMAGVISKVLDIVMTPLNWLTEHLIGVFVEGCKANDTCKKALNSLNSQVTKLVDFIIGNLMHIPWSDAMNGGRIITMIIAGADVGTNQSCKNLLGCQRVSDQVAANIRDEHMTEVKQDFQRRPILARLFSTDTPYSLMSRLSLAMPSKVSTMGSTITRELFRSPLAAFGDLFGSVFQTNQAFATPFDKDPFGVDQYAYPAGSMPTHPYEFWQNNCVKGPYGKYDESKKPGERLDISDWLNDDANVGFNENTGESYFKRANPCLLIQSSAQSAGAMFDPSMIPPDDNTIGEGTSPVAEGGDISGNAKELAQQILDNKNITLIDNGNPYYAAKQDIELAAKGKPGTCGKPLDPRLLQIALAIAQDHTVTITALESHCGGHMDGSRHYDGKAIDFGNIDGVVACKKIASVWSDIKQYASGAIFLQKQCAPGTPVPSGMDWRVGDANNHQHIQF